MRENRMHGLMREGRRGGLWPGYRGTAGRKGRKQLGWAYGMLKPALYSTLFTYNPYWTIMAARWEGSST